MTTIRPREKQTSWMRRRDGTRRVWTVTSEDVPAYLSAPQRVAFMRGWSAAQRAWRDGWSGVSELVSPYVRRGQTQAWLLGADFARTHYEETRP